LAFSNYLAVLNAIFRFGSAKTSVSVLFFM